MTLWIVINREGIADLSTASYELSVIENGNRLSYEKADKLLKVDTPNEEVSLLQSILKELDAVA